MIPLPKSPDFSCTLARCIRSRIVVHDLNCQKSTHGSFFSPLMLPSTPPASTSLGSSRSRQRHKRLHLDNPASTQAEKAVPSTTRSLFADTLAVEEQCREPQLKRRRIALACGTCRSRKSKVSNENTRKINAQHSASFSVQCVDHTASVMGLAQNAQCARS